MAETSLQSDAQTESMTSEPDNPQDRLNDADYFGKKQGTDAPRIPDIHRKAREGGSIEAKLNHEHEVTHHRVSLASDGDTSHDVNEQRKCSCGGTPDNECEHLHAVRLATLYNGVPDVGEEI